QEKAILSITRQQRVKEELYLYLLNKREENELAHAITESNARVIDFSFGPATPVAPKSSIIMLAALLIGLGIPFVIFYMLEMLNTSIRGRKDIEDNLSVPFLGDIPQHTGSTVKGIAVRENGRDTVSEAFRMLRSNMTFMNAQSEKMKTILITSSNPHAGKTFITMNTAMTLAMTDKKVVLLDLDLRRRTLSKYLGKGSAEGMSGYISGKVTDIRDVIIPSGIHKNLDIIAAGPMPPNPAEMLLSKRLDAVVKELESSYDYILIDSVPAMNVADAMICDRLCDLCIYVVREGLLDRRQLPDIERLYREKKFHNMCVVLNGSTGTNHYRYGYGYGYGYSYGYGLENGKTNKGGFFASVKNLFSKNKQ
ncbi:MAG: polysaccharide biosynthesis tyrosine autokinase, partial [Alistipes sp.]|nr:polysaccharide biosynthesis tyrosine autokinase [Alistipes sp.]